ncbi:hypothetical protein [Mycoplasmopsis agalactiae]|nr:hypothetical protein [Mycoplasmopsis agalactiae]
MKKSCIVNFSGNFYKLKKAYSKGIKFLSENQINNNQPDAVNAA